MGDDDSDQPTIDLVADGHEVLPELPIQRLVDFERLTVEEKESFRRELTEEQKEILRQSNVEPENIMFITRDNIHLVENQMLKLHESMPTSTIEERHLKAEEQKGWANLQSNIQLEIEKERILEARKKHEEMFDTWKIDCPICLENISFRSSQVCHFNVCCGVEICKSCDEAMRGRVKGCPLCRAPSRFYGSPAWLKSLKRSAKRGVAGAQHYLSALFSATLDGSKFGVRQDIGEGNRLLFLAAEQGYPLAQYQLGLNMMLGSGGIERDIERSRELLRLAAEAGLLDACSTRANSLYSDEEGSDNSLAIQYATVAVAGSCDIDQGHNSILGKSFLYGLDDLPKNGFLAQHYLTAAVRKGLASAETLRLCGQAILEQNKATYGELCLVPGHCSVSDAMYCFDRAIDRDDSEAKSLARELLDVVSRQCAFCGREAKDDETFMKCGKCQAVHYCQKSCQVAAWKSGHKINCTAKYKPPTGFAKLMPGGILPPGVDPETGAGLRIMLPDGTCHTIGSDANGK
mmetsp:Transcript_34766/g.78033  ORF Transcript_34766/g.78033 Transcript_34766/m.78033 type:complete len:518 (-) Transcript_34766:127-1680(-)